MTLDRWIALIFLIFCLVYGYSAYTYPLLPFERNMAFLPNTLPTALSILGALVSLFILITHRVDKDGKDVKDDIDWRKLHEYKIGQAVLMLGLMALYALALRPIGFLPATIAFLVVSGWVLGERKLHIMIPVAAIGAGGIWYIVQEVLGIFLKPLPFEWNTAAQNMPALFV